MHAARLAAILTAGLLASAAHAQIDQAITIQAQANHAVTDPPFPVRAESSQAGTLSFSSLTLAICTAGPMVHDVNSIYYEYSTITLTGIAGDCTIAVDAAGGNGLNPAPRATVTMKVVAFNAALVTNANNTTFTSGSPATFTFTTSAGFTPTYSLTGSLPAGVLFNAANATLSGTPTATGTFNLTFNLFDSGVIASSQAFTLTVIAGGPTQDQTITVGAGVGSHGTGDPLFTLRAVASGNTQITMTSLTPSVCTIGPTQYTTLSIYNYFADVTLTGIVGTCSISIDAAPDLVYRAAHVVSSGNIGSGTTLSVAVQGGGSGTVISTNPAGAINCGAICVAQFPTGSTITLSANPASGSVFVGWSGACSGSAGCQVTVNALSSVAANFGIPPLITSANSVSFTVNTSSTFTVTTTGSPTPSLSASGVLPPGVGFNIASGTFSGIPALGSVGAYSLTLHGVSGVPPDATQSFMLTISKADQVIAFANPGPQTLSAVALNPIATSTSGLGVVFTSSTLPVCTVTANTVDLHSSGTCTLNANQPGDPNYNPATQVSRSFAIGGTAPGITSANATSFTVNAAGTFTVTATGVPAPALSLTGALPSGVSFTPATGAIAGTPALGTVGSYPVTIGAANSVLPNASQSFTLTVAKRSQAISFTNPGAHVFSTTAFALAATATSGLAIAFTSATPQVCAVSGGSLTMLTPGTCTINANQAGDANYNAAPQQQLSFTIDAPQRLGNISTRMQVLAGNDVMIAGFIIGGSTAKTVVINVAGPSLVPFGIPNALMNPTLKLVRSSDQVVLATNDNWQTQAIPADVAAIQASGFQPNNAAEPALIATLPPGAYTAIVEGSGGTTGVGLVGVFEVDHPEIPLVNISTRGQVLTINDVMIAGFIIQGTGSQKVVINVAGPSLVPFGIPNALMNPTLTLVRSSDQVTLATNDNWQTQTNPGDVALIQATGFQPNNAAEPAIIATLPPGAYTAIVSGVDGTTGVGLVGVFVAP